MSLIPFNTRFIEPGIEFELANGQCLKRVRLAYETFGQPTGPCVLILGGLSADAHVTSSDEDPSRGWWEPVVGAGRAIDTRELFVVCVNYLGGCAGSTGPASLDPETGEPYSLNFPTLTLDDLARAAMHVVTDLGVEDIDLLIGTSMGAMVALPFMARFAGTVRCHVSISGCLRASPAALALRGIQRDMIRRAYRDGEASSSFDIEQVKLARKISLLSYRPATAWESRFGRRPSVSDRHSCCVEDRFEIQSYLEAHAEKYVKRFDPRSFVILSEALDLFDPTIEHGAPHSSVPERVLVMGAITDALYSPQQQTELAAYFEARGSDVVTRVMNSPYGHDSFLIDAEMFGEQVRKSVLGTMCPRGNSTSRSMS